MLPKEPFSPALGPSAIGLDAEELVSSICEGFPEFSRPETIAPSPGAQAGASARRGWFAQLRDLLHRPDGRFDLLFRVERSE